MSAADSQTSRAWKDVIAGTAGGLATVLAGHPLVNFSQKFSIEIFSFPR